MRGIRRDAPVAVRPEEADILVQRAGARTAEMRGRAISRGWLRVDIDTLDDDAALYEWIDVAVAYAERRANAS